MRFLLLPFSIIYGLVIWIRNKCYDWGLIKTVSPIVKTIGIGNLRVGGTGKTPMVEYLVNYFQFRNKVAVLSRGYGRDTKGFRMVDFLSKVDEVGDEPLQMKKRFPDIAFAVCENRSYGVEELKRKEPNLDVIILDDVLQHRSIKPGLMILLTSFDQLFTDDWLLPVGMLREGASGARRADIIIVTKTPAKLYEAEKNEVIKKVGIKPSHKVLFAFEEFEHPIHWSTGQTMDLIKVNQIILITGIANPVSLINHIENTLVSPIAFHYQKSDHFRFTDKDLAQLLHIQKRYPGAIFITTLKDFQRLYLLLQNDNFKNIPLYVIGLKTGFFDSDQKDFNKLLDEYLRTSH